MQTTENLQLGTIGMGADYTSDVWFTQLYSAICFEFSWSGSDAATGTVELQVSVSGENWSCYGDAAGVFTTTVGSDFGHIEVPHITYPYWRLKYTANSVTTGLLVIRTYGKPLFPRT